jgi:fluoride ion exporter CrcB/FEX
MVQDLDRALRVRRYGGRVPELMGGLTTYSTFSHETVRLTESGAWHHAWIDILVTTVICLSLRFLGIGIGRAFLALRG